MGIFNFYDFGQSRRKVLLGAHMSISGGVANALLAGKYLDCTAIQMFTKSSNQWKAKPLSEDDITGFRLLQRQSGIMTVAHDSYLINLGSPDKALLDKSRKAFLEEMERCEKLEIPYLVTHPGSHVGVGEEIGLHTIVESLNWLYTKTPDSKVIICLETTAGQGSNLGYKFEQIAFLIDESEESDRLGVCLDTCHIFAAGYEIRNKKAYNKTMTEFDRVIGLNRLKVVHINDSKKDLGSKVDRHEHIGKGFIGIEPFGYFLNDRRLKKLPFLLETPKGDDGEMDDINLGILRGLIKK
ncbi:MAG: deoxyribonuclease IV [candidate division Zixibacteria bacterium CG_4_9_14_3_um_filter_46_8]|nr:MAG: deoxyribonuclease IV [candidate division Zixibacteria bacterium CG_4_9_14_3_um_filter_46_8]